MYKMLAIVSIAPHKNDEKTTIAQSIRKSQRTRKTAEKRL